MIPRGGNSKVSPIVQNAVELAVSLEMDQTPPGQLEKRMAAVSRYSVSK